jgi:hypothetical protein
VEGGSGGATDDGGDPHVVVGGRLARIWWSGRRSGETQGGRAATFAERVESDAAGAAVEDSGACVRTRT